MVLLVSPALLWTLDYSGQVSRLAPLNTVGETAPLLRSCWGWGSVSRVSLEACNMQIPRPQAKPRCRQVSA